VVEENIIKILKGVNANNFEKIKKYLKSKEPLVPIEALTTL
jgi:hypothetical protein